MAYEKPVVAINTNANVNIASPGTGAWDGVASSTFTAGTTRVLLVFQTTTPSQNGVWIWNGSSTALSRPVAPDQYKTTNVLDNATLIPVQQGSTYAGSVWGVDPAAVITVDTTSHTLTRVSLPPVQARVASTSNLSSFASVAIIDGVTLAGNGAQGSDIVLLKDQTTASANGLYWACPAGTMVRCTEPLPPARQVDVSEGTANAHTHWALVTQGAIVIGTTLLTFVVSQVSLPPVQARVASTSNLSSLASVTAIDGVTLAGSGTYGSDIVLLKDQATASANGLYWANPAGTMVRCTEPLPPARQVDVSEGTANAHTHWALVTQGAIVIGTTALRFSRQLVRANVKDFGALGNGGTTHDGQTTATSTILTSLSAGFTALNVPAGTPILVVGAGASGANLVTIATYASATTVTLATSASTSVTNAVIVWGTDDSQAIANAIGAMTSAGGALLFPPGTYVVGGAATVTAPSNVQVTFEEGAMLAPFAYPVTLNGRVTGHPTQQIFGGAGRIGPITAGGTSPPTVTATGNPLGSIPPFEIVTVSGVSSTVSITAGGSGYTTPPTVTFSASPYGTVNTATGTATVAGGAVTAVTVTNIGSYTSAPIITFSGGGGSGATATATLANPTATLGTMTFVYNGFTSWSATLPTTSGSSYSYTVPGTGVTITFSSGTYTVGDNYQWSLTPAVALTSSAIAQHSVKWWGAKGDGTTDDWGPITATINAIRSIGGCVLFPPGTYNCNETLSLNDIALAQLGVTLEGQGGAQINAGGASTLISIQDSLYLTLRNLRLTCTTACTGALVDCSSTGITDTSNLLFDNVYFDGADATHPTLGCLRLDRTILSVIRTCTFAWGTYQIRGRVTGYSNGIVIERCYFYYGTSNACIYNAGQFWTIDSCDFTASAAPDNGLTFYAIWDDGVVTSTYDKLVIVNCDWHDAGAHIHGGTRNWINLTNAHGVTITGCVFPTPGAANDVRIALASCSGASITHCKFFDSANPAIQLTGTATGVTIGSNEYDDAANNPVILGSSTVTNGLMLLPSSAGATHAPGTSLTAALTVNPNETVVNVTPELDVTGELKIVGNTASPGTPSGNTNIYRASGYFWINTDQSAVEVIGPSGSGYYKSWFDGASTESLRLQSFTAAGYGVLTQLSSPSRGLIVNSSGVAIFQSASDFYLQVSGGAIRIEGTYSTGNLNLTATSVTVASPYLNLAGQLSSAYQGSSTGGTVTPDWNSGMRFTTGVLTSNLTVNNGNNPRDGAQYVVRTVQDAIGGHTHSWGTEYKFGGISSAGVTTANKVNLWRFIYNAAAVQYECMGTNAI